MIIRAIDGDPLTAIEGDPSSESITLQFNPNALQRAISVRYQNRQILGLSHSPHEYLGTDNAAISFSVFYNVETRAQLAESDRAMRFLESLAYGPEAPGGILTAAPTRVLLLWPKTMSIVARLMSVTFQHERWNVFGNTTQWSAACSFEEARITRLTSKDVKILGAQRVPASISGSNSG
jgi:hypothetical protein